MSEKWRRATLLYQEETARQKTAEENRKLQEPRSNDPRDVVTAIHELETFMHRQEGKAAMELLGASEKFIIFGIEKFYGGTSFAYMLSGVGLTKAIHPVLFSANSHHDHISPAEMVEVAMNPDLGNKRPAEIMNWLRSELNKIADRAPNPLNIWYDSFGKRWAETKPGVFAPSAAVYEAERVHKLRADSALYKKEQQKVRI